GHPPGPLGPAVVAGHRGVGRSTTTPTYTPASNVWPRKSTTDPWRASRRARFNARTHVVHWYAWKVPRTPRDSFCPGTNDGDGPSSETVGTVPWLLAVSRCWVVRPSLTLRTQQPLLMSDGARRNAHPVDSFFERRLAFYRMP